MIILIADTLLGYYSEGDAGSVNSVFSLLEQQDMQVSAPARVEQWLPRSFCPQVPSSFLACSWLTP
jgi:hypothetical protein